VDEFLISMNRSIKVLRREWPKRQVSECPIIDWNSVDYVIPASRYSIPEEV